MLYVKDIFRFVIQTAVDAGDFLAPPASFSVIQAEDLAMGPMEVVRDKGYLLKKLIEGITLYAPPRPSAETSKV
jgi:hypothetical protein